MKQLRYIIPIVLSTVCANASDLKHISVDNIDGCCPAGTKLRLTYNMQQDMQPIVETYPVPEAGFKQPIISYGAFKTRDVTSLSFEAVLPEDAQEWKLLAPDLTTTPRVGFSKLKIKFRSDVTAPNATYIVTSFVLPALTFEHNK
jgi:hypothetical protein